MNSERFNALIALKIKDLILFIIKNEQMSFESAVKYLYPSKLMQCLTDEKSKLWHLSTAKLHDMLDNEKKTNELVFPDFV